MPNPSVQAVIVAYDPDLGLLAKVVAATAAQVAHVLVIANDGGGWVCPLPENAILQRQAQNLGLGAAYNLAAAWAREKGAERLLVLDQDSVPAPGMVAALAAALDKPRAAAAGPLWRDARTGEDGFFVRLTKFGARKIRVAPGEVAPVDFLISSGSLIALDALADIGPFDEALFIEHVDTDWTLRARAKGYRLYGVADARLDHAFGEETRVAPIVQRRFFLYPPARNYYLLRNSIALWRRSYAPWPWILHDVRRTGLLMLYYALFVPPRRERWRQMARAVRDARSLSGDRA